MEKKEELKEKLKGCIADYSDLDGLVEVVEKELDKAREDVLIELQKEFSEFGVPDDVRYTQPLFYINEVIEKKLSKLKTKEDGK